MAQDTTLDGLLNRRIMLEQPRRGFRVAMDTVMLAAAVPAAPDAVGALDMGCGVGGASLCLGWRLRGVRITGVEIQADLVELARRNVARNLAGGALARPVEIAQGDVTQLPSEFSDAFDHALMNPPYHDTAVHEVSADAGRRRANSGTGAELQGWIAAAQRALKTGGWLSLIHRADCEAAILGLMGSGFGGVEVIRLLPKSGLPAKRVILRGIKGKAATAPVQTDFILHKVDGRYTDAAESILRDGQSLESVLR